jgi:hypothetical protein
LVFFGAFPGLTHEMKEEVKKKCPIQMQAGIEN